MNKTNRQNLENRFDSGDDVLDYFETGAVLNIYRLKEISAVLNLSALAREAGVNLHTLQAKIRRETPLSGAETAALVAALKRFHLATVA
jgi:hypothetical protein